MVLSIVIPVYNTEKYIKECIDSIVPQIKGSDDIEIILVDDGSTDKSGEICDECSSDYSNIKVIHQTNKGPGGARNTGFNMATGEYIWFIDSDDCVSETAITTIISKMKEDKLDILLFSAKTISDGAVAIHNYKRSICLNEVLPGRETFRRTIDKNEYITSVCLRIYRKQFLFQIGLMFEEGIFYEDESYAFISMMKAERVEIICDELYIRRYRKGSTMTEQQKGTESEFRRFLIGNNSAYKQTIEEYTKSTFSEEDKKMYLRRADYYMKQIIKRWSKSSVYQKDMKRELLSMIINNRNKYHSSSLQTAFLFHFPRIYLMLYRIYRVIYLQMQSGRRFRPD